MSAARQINKVDLDLADQLLTHVEAADEVGRDTDRLERGEDVLGNPVVQHALAADRAALLGVKRGRVVLEILDQGPRLRTLVEDLGFPFIDLAAASHVGAVTPAKTGKGRYRRAVFPRQSAVSGEMP